MPQNRTKAFLKQLYYNNYPVLLRYGVKLVGDRPLVKDVIQSLFLRFFENNTDLTGHPAPDAYVVKSFRRALLRNIQVLNLVDYTVPEKMGTGFIQYSHEDLWIQEEETAHHKNKVLDILNSLSDRQREIVWLHYYEEKSYQEIAEILDINYQSVLNNLQRAFRKIRSVYPDGIR
ncbi:MAG TPA: sigma-70 family RNA polymerase sigma factor [Membranihabitans sp.]|nr:sigma-70 family RNA polymerase sigma factor [Membranihabitans sp.]